MRLWAELSWAELKQVLADWQKGEAINTLTRKPQIWGETETATTTQQAGSFIERALARTSSNNNNNYETSIFILTIFH